MSEKGSPKSLSKSIDFTSQTSCQYAGREDLLCWTNVAMTGCRTYPEQTPDAGAAPGSSRSPRLRSAWAQATAPPTHRATGQSGHGGVDGAYPNVVLHGPCLTR